MSIKNQLATAHYDISKFIKTHPLMKQLDELVSIDTAVVGGAVRDMTLGKPIKDIDIVLSFNFFHNSKITYPNYQTDDEDHEVKIQASEASALQAKERQILALLGKEEYNFLHEEMLRKNNNKINLMNLISLLIQHIIIQSPNHAINQVFQEKQNLEQKQKQIIPLKDHAYSSIGLSGVISLKDKNCQYPIELLLTTNSVREFVDSFDFGFCKVYMSDENEIIKTEDFNHDINQKKITYIPPQDVTENKMNKSLLTRYVRLQEKFPDYNLCLDTKNINNSNLLETIKSHVSSISIYHKFKYENIDSLSKENKFKSSKI